MGTPALFFILFVFFSDDINKLYCVEWKKARKSTKFLYFWGQKGRCPLYVHKNGGFAKNIDKNI